MGNIQLQSMRIGFNNVGKDMFYELSSTNATVLQGLKSFLIDLNINGIMLSKGTFNAVLKDMKCAAYEGDATDPLFQKSLFKQNPDTKVKSLDDIFIQLQEFMKENNLALSPKTQKKLTTELSIAHKTNSHDTPSVNPTHLNEL